MRLWRAQLALAAPVVFVGSFMTTVETVRPTSSETDIEPHAAAPVDEREEESPPAVPANGGPSGHWGTIAQSIGSSGASSNTNNSVEAQHEATPVPADGGPKSHWGMIAHSLGMSGASSNSNSSAEAQHEATPDEAHGHSSHWGKLANSLSLFTNGEHPQEEGVLQQKARKDVPGQFPLEVSHTANGAVLNFPNGTKDIKVQDIRLDPGTPGDFKNNLLGLDAELGAHQVGTIPDAMMTFHTNALRAEKGTDYWYDQAKWVRERGANDWRDALLHTLYRIDTEERLVAKTIGNDYRSQPESAENDPTAMREPRMYPRDKEIPHSKWQQETSAWKLESGGGLNDGSWTKWLFG